MNSNNTNTIEFVTTEVTTEEKLDVLNNLRNAYNDLLEAFKAQNADLIEQIDILEAEIKNDVLEYGKTVKGENLMAVWNTGRTTWDGKTLKVLEKQFPEIGIAKKIGEPTVSFRKVITE